MSSALDVYSGAARNAIVLGQQDLAHHILEKSLEIRRKHLDYYRTQPNGEHSVNTQLTMWGIGANLAMLGRYSETGTIFTQLIEIQKTSEIVSLSSKSAAIANLGWTLFRQQKSADAEVTLREAVRRFEEIHSETWERYNSESMLGAALLGMKKFNEAEAFLVSSYPKLLERKPAPRPDSAFTAELEAGERILTLYREWGKPEKVAEWQQKLQSNKAPTITPVLR
jgi:tetratricopeptide (TPR) repeat protein